MPPVRKPLNDITRQTEKPRVERVRKDRKTIEVAAFGSSV